MKTKKLLLQNQFDTEKTQGVTVTLNNNSVTGTDS